MKRREFLKTAAVAGVAVHQVNWRFVEAAVAPSPTRLIPRRPYRDGVELSTIGFGGIVVVGLEQRDANRIVATSVERGVNYFDVAPSYGNAEAEEKLGIALEPYRDQVFLACKTGRRDAEGAEKELEQSLQRLHTDHVDLYQFHAVSKMEEVEQLLAPGGAAEVFLKARDQGKVRFVGFSAHSVQAALALLDRFECDSVLFPLNFVCWAQGDFGSRILQRAKEKGVARLALKALAYTRWSEGEERAYPKCWYRPVDDPELARQALQFTLSEDITAAIPPGDERLYRLALDLASNLEPLAPEKRQQLLAGTESLKPIFRRE